MHQTYRWIAAAAACLTGFAAIALILWPAWPMAGGTTFPWDSGGWQALLVATDGRAMPLPGRSFLLIAVVILLAITLVSTSLSVLAAPTPELAVAMPAPRPSDIDQQVNTEVSKLLQLVRTHLEANGLYGSALAKVSDQLPNIATPEQMRMVVSYLILENDNMRKKTANLQANLEVSKKTIDQLRNNLAVAKVEILSDSLTAVKNRRAFDLALASELAEARGTGRPVCLVMADIDHFKSVNDRYGHPVGDEVLKWFAQLLGLNVKGRDVVARYGGEEFAIILPETAIADAVSLAGQIKAEVEARPFVAGNGLKSAIKITASFGVVQWRDGESTDNLVKRADTKLYEAKAAGRNRVAA